MKLKKNKRLAIKKIENNFFMVSPWDHKLHKCNETATFIIDMVNKGMPEADIALEIAAKFEVSPATAKEHIGEFLHKLLELGLYSKV